jgi:putative endonuclease
MYKKQEVGKFGEAVVQDYLLQNNYKIIEKNFNTRAGEIDIIAKDIKKNEIVFIEVKTRNNDSYGTPAEAVNGIKRTHIIKTARYFLHRYHLEEEFVRIDVVEVYIKSNKTYKLNHIIQAF